MPDQLSDLVKVTLVFFDLTTNDHMIRKEDLDKFVEASKQLHYNPGKNPHNGGNAKPICAITVETDLRWTGPFWWTTPGLKRNGDPAGVQLLQGTPRMVWKEESG
jgi:hypothetical protein